MKNGEYFRYNKGNLGMPFSSASCQSVTRMLLLMVMWFVMLLNNFFFFASCLCLTREMLYKYYNIVSFTFPYGFYDALPLPVFWGCTFFGQALLNTHMSQFNPTSPWAFSTITYYKIREQCLGSKCTVSTRNSFSLGYQEWGRSVLC